MAKTKHGHLLLFHLLKLIAYIYILNIPTKRHEMFSFPHLFNFERAFHLVVMVMRIICIFQ